MQNQVQSLSSNAPAGLKTYATAIGRSAIRSLYAELALYPKPGLVSPVDNGSHQDMDMATFMRSLFSLRSYFPAIAVEGGMSSEFSVLRALGINAERRMMLATNGINTHRGAVFNLGFLAAAAAHCHVHDGLAGPEEICLRVGDLWGSEILRGRPLKGQSNGLKATAAHGGPGAREEAASGYPVVRNVALPAYRQALRQGFRFEQATVQTLFSIMAVLNDTNILYRAGRDGLDVVRAESVHWLEKGGVASADWRVEAERIHRLFCDMRISPGGAADLLSCTLFVHAIASEGFPVS